jgi:peptide/nickel transport system permease protein
MRTTRISRLITLIKKRPLVFLAILGLLISVLCAVFAPVISPYNPAQQDLPAQLRPPGLKSIQGSVHLLGTDRLGRDLLSYIFYGLRVSLIVGFGAVLVSCMLGMILGMIAGFYRGATEVLIMRLADFQLAIPLIILALFVMAIFGKGLIKMVLVLGIGGWTVYARTIRAGVLSVRGKEYIEAERALAASGCRIMFKHIFPNVVTPIVVLTAVQLPRMILAEATMSFLGMGVPVLTPSLGIAISNGQAVLYSGAWWVSVLPGLALAFVTVNINIIADWLRDVLDPRV